MKAPVTGALRGYVTIRVRGYGAERFFRLCTGRDIAIWNMSRCEDDSYRCSIHRTDFFKLRPICRKTGTKVRIESRGGLPKYVRRYRNRLLFFAAFWGMVFCVCRCSARIWKIEITGNSYISDENLIRFLKEEGVTQGMRRADIDTDAIELQLRLNYAQVIWASAYVDGTSLVLCVQEQIKTEQADRLDGDTAYDLVASKNARIASIVTRRGSPCVVAGEEVLAGDVLVSARCDIYNDDGEVMDSLYQQADADVYGYVSYSFSESLPVQSLIQTDTDEVSTNYFIRAFGQNLCIPHNTSPYEEYYSIENVHQLCLFDNFYLPVYWGTREYGKRESGYYILAKEKAKETAKEDFLYFVRELEENGVSIIDKNVMIEEAGNCYEVTGQVLALEAVAVAAPAEIPPVLEEEQLINEYE